MSNQNNSSTSSDWCDSQCWSFLGFRLFLAFRWLFAGLDKFELDGTYSFANYYVNMDRMATGIAGSSILPLWSTKLFALPSGYLMLLLGLTILLGIKMRLSLIVSLFPLPGVDGGDDGGQRKFRNRLAGHPPSHLGYGASNGQLGQMGVMERLT